MTARHALCLLLPLACAPRAATPSAAPERGALALSQSGHASADVQEMPCPEDIVREPKLGAGVENLTAGAWLPSAAPGTLAQAVHFRDYAERSRETLALASGTHQLVQYDQGLVLLRELPQGACVVNTWGVFLAQDIHVQTAGSWRSADGRLAVLLLSIPAKDEHNAPQPRWVVLTTDGHRLWPAVGEADQQLMVPAVSLVEKGGQLQLHVRQSRTSVYAFDSETGRFVTP